MNTSQQERSKRTAARLLQAAEDLAGEVGFDRLTLASVAQRAECTTGAVYGRFGSKAALLDALHARHVERGILRFTSRLSELSPESTPRERLETLVALFVDEYEEHWPIIAAFAAVLSSEPAFGERHVVLVQTLTARSSEVLSAPAEDVVLCVALVMGTMDRTMRLRELAPHLLLPDKTKLVKRLTGACAALLDG